MEVVGLPKTSVVVTWTIVLPSLEPLYELCWVNNGVLGLRVYYSSSLCMDRERQQRYACQEETEHWGLWLSGVRTFFPSHSLPNMP